MQRMNPYSAYGPYARAGSPPPAYMARRGPPRGKSQAKRRAGDKGNHNPRARADRRDDDKGGRSKGGDRSRRSRYDDDRNRNGHRRSPLGRRPASRRGDEPDDGFGSLRQRSRAGSDYE